MTCHIFKSLIDRVVPSRSFVPQSSITMNSRHPVKLGHPNTCPEICIFINSTVVRGKAYKVFVQTFITYQG